MEVAIKNPMRDSARAMDHENFLPWGDGSWHPSLKPRSDNYLVRAFGTCTHHDVIDNLIKEQIMGTELTMIIS